MERRNQWLAAFGAVTMLIDHIGVLFFPGQTIFRLIGRLSFPLFAYGIAMGVAHTSSLPKYLLRILAAALLSQPIYFLAFGLTTGNPLFTLALGAVALMLWEKKGLWRLGTGLIALTAYHLHLSYGWYGVATIVAFGLYHKRQAHCFYVQFVLQYFYCITTGVWLQAFSLLAFPFIGFRTQQTIHLPKFFLYFFYPVHLLILSGLRLFFTT